MDNLTFSDLEFNLYEILNLSYNCTSDEIKVKFKKLVKKFHPDKMSELEEKIYYYITLAHHILINTESRNLYDMWLIKLNNQELILEKNNKESENNIHKRKDMSKYFPQNYDNATTKFNDKTDFDIKFNLYDEDSRSFSQRYTEKINQLNNLEQISKEKFKNMKEFNNIFNNRIEKGDTNYNIIDYNNKQINIYNNINNNNDLKYSYLKDSKTFFTKGTTISPQYTSIDIAYKLQKPTALKENKSLDSAINNYNNQTSILQNNNNNLTNFNI